MSNNIDVFAASAAKTSEDAMAIFGKLFRVAEPGVVFSPPVTANDHTVITASEIYIGMGLGFGGGGGGPAEEQARKKDAGDTKSTTGKEGAGDTGMGGGVGGGGGGASAGRPVAAIIIGPSGVKVEPIVDATKIAITFFTALGAIFMAARAMRSFGRR